MLILENLVDSFCFHNAYWKDNLRAFLFFFLSLNPNRVEVYQKALLFFSQFVYSCALQLLIEWLAHGLSKLILFEYI